jgi:hypothetical protein
MTGLKILLISIFTCGCLFMTGQAPVPPSGVLAEAYESHVELRWKSSAGATSYKIYRSEDGGASFSLLVQVGDTQSIIDWTGDEGQNLTRHYKLTALNPGGDESGFSATVIAQTQPMGDSALLDMVQRSCFRYYWDYAHPVSGMARERNNGDPNTVTTGGTGFGVLAIVVATSRGWVTRDTAVTQMIKLVSFLQSANTFHGAFPHWMDGNTGEVIPFSQYDDGADLVETAFLMQGLLTARQYFDQNNAQEAGLRSAITSLWEHVQWDWFRRGNGPVLYWHWSPDYAWTMNFPLRGFFEAQIVYILAAASPTHPVPGSLYQTGWTSSNYANNSSYYGLPIYCGPYGGGPMFFAHYSYLGFDPRNLKDAYCNYFVRNRHHALIQHAYSVANPLHYAGYSGDCWGLTASDDPVDGYKAHDIYAGNDNGTITPTAALASMPYTPDESLAALKYFYRVKGDKLWGPYGFYDAFNQKLNWVAPSYLAIDQGPITDMIENYRTGLLWQKFMQNPEIMPALQSMGFLPDNSAAQEPDIRVTGYSVQVSPNPVSAQDMLHLEFSLLRPQTLSAALYSPDGHIKQTLLSEVSRQAGVFTDQFVVPTLPAGIYLLKVQNENHETITRKIVLAPH